MCNFDDAERAFVDALSHAIQVEDRLDAAKAESRAARKAVFEAERAIGPERAEDPEVILAMMDAAVEESGVDESAFSVRTLRDAYTRVIKEREAVDNGMDPTVAELYTVLGVDPRTVL